VNGRATNPCGALLLRTAAALAAASGAGCDGERGNPPAPAATGATGDVASLLDEPLETPKPGDRARALERLEEARRYSAAVRFAEAHEVFTQAVQTDPACVSLRVEFGFFLLGNPEGYGPGEALEQFRYARLVEPDDPLARCGEGIARAWLGDFARAEPLLRAALASEEVTRHAAQASTAKAALGDAASAAGRSDEALRLYEDAAAGATQAKRRGEFMVKRAELLWQLEKSAEAEKVLREAVKLDPENVRGHYLLGQACAKRGETLEAAREAKVHEILRQLSDHTSHRFMQDVERRLRLRRELNAAWPEYVRGPYELVRELLTSGRYKDAVVEISALGQRDGPTAEIHFLLARARAGGGDLVGAKVSVDAMRKADPNVPVAVIRGVLEEWRRGRPEVTDAQMQATLDQWLGR
jgi:predicted Zn-dependent protease